MIKKLVAIGGGENGRKLENGLYAPYNTEKIDREIVKLANKKSPNFLFLGHAMNHLKKIEEDYYITMIIIYGDRFGCRCRNLKSDDLADEKKVKEMLEWADIIYEGGGDTKSMIDLWKKTGFDKKLYYAWNNGKIICGISAGAVCYFNSCNSEIEGSNNEYTSIDCLNWINLYLTPHGNITGRLEYTKKALEKNDLVGITLSDCSALFIINDKYKVVNSEDDAFCLKSYFKNNEYVEKQIKNDTKFKNLNQLFIQE